MLGARARAAEYNAFKAASARQASREAEEQKLPPKPVPISLSAFTKTAQVNRNKGNKNWIPLVLEDTAEDEEEDNKENDVPTYAISDLHDTDIDPAALTDSDKSATTAGERKIRVKIPTAPKAMIAAQDRSTVQANLAPPRLSQTTIAAQPLVSMHHGMELDPSHIDVNGQIQDATPDGMRRFGDIMVPTDISPTKQEEKLAMLSSVFAKPFSNPGPDEPHHNHFQQQPFMNYSDLHNAYMNLHLHQAPSEVDGQLPMPIYQILQRPRPRAFPSDTAPSSTAIPATPSNNATITRHLSYSNLTPNSISRPPSSHRAACISHALEIKPPPETDDNDEPYDRNSKMQKFVAAQQALAKKGKTVLHNPDLHRSETDENVVSDDMDVLDSTSSSNDPIKPTCSILRDDVTTKAALQETTEPSNAFANERLDVDQWRRTPLDQGNVLLRQKFNVGSSAWFDLRPTTVSERQRMTETVHIVASQMTINVQPSVHQNKENNRDGTIRKWLDADPRGMQASRERIDQIAKEYSTRKAIERTILRPQRSEDSEDCVDSHAGVVRAAGHVLANLAEYLDQNRAVQGASDHFSKFKPAPEFAVERTGSLGNGSSPASYFEKDRSGFYNAPVRIARDPRFRPQVKDGTKLKPEDEWKLRHEMYGRRRL